MYNSETLRTVRAATNRLEMSIFVIQTYIRIYINNKQFLDTLYVYPKIVKLIHFSKHSKKGIIHSTITSALVTNLIHERQSLS